MSNINDVLIVVDVQNCFMFGGSFTGHLVNKEKDEKGEIIKLTPDEINNLCDAIDQINQIVELINVHKHIIFTRDYHPVNHMSMTGIGDEKNSDPRETNWTNVFPIHCRNKNSFCEKNTIQSNETNKVSGTHNTGNTRSTNNAHGESENSTKILDYCNTILGRIKGHDINLHKINYKTLDFKKISEDAPKIDKIENFFKSIKTNIEDKNIKDNKNEKNIPILGTDISYLFAGTKYHNEFFNLLKKTPIGLDLTSSNNKINQNDKNYKNNQFNQTNINFINDITNPNHDLNKYVHYSNDSSDSSGNIKTFCQLTKGEYCEYESYSAFNYHIKLSYKDDKHENNNYEVKSENLKCDKKYSTGMCEYLEKILKPNQDTNQYTNSQISICGNVGNVCVMYTLIQGKLMTQLYTPLQNINFIYQTLGTRWVVPFDRNPNFDIDNFTEDKHMLFIIDNALETLKNNDIKHIDFNIKINNDMLNFKINDDTYKSYSNTMNDNIEKINSIESQSAENKKKLLGSSFVKLVNLEKLENIKKPSNTQTGGKYKNMYIYYKKKYINLKNI